MHSREGGRVLVTGATGFTGSHLARRLVERGASVVAFVRESSDTRELLRLGVECRTVDIRDRDAVLGGFEPFSRVFHLAALFREQPTDPGEFRRVNAEATGHLLEAAHGHGVGRFVHCSTVGVQGRIDDPPARESYRLRPGDAYQRSKLEGEWLAREWMEHGLAVTIVRPAGIYGPGDTRFLKLFRAVQRGWFVMVGSGETLYHLTYVDDLVNGFVLATDHPAAVGDVFTLAGPRYTTLNELVAAIADAVGAPRPRWRVPYAPVHAAAALCDRLWSAVGAEPPLYPRRVEFFHYHRAFDIGKARRVLGYAPEVDLEHGLARTAAWYRSRGLLRGRTAPRPATPTRSSRPERRARA